MQIIRQEKINLFHRHIERSIAKIESILPQNENTSDEIDLMALTIVKNQFSNLKVKKNF